MKPSVNRDGLGGTSYHSWSNVVSIQYYEVQDGWTKRGNGFAIPTAPLRAKLCTVSNKYPLSKVFTHQQDMTKASLLGSTVWLKVIID